MIARCAARQSPLRSARWACSMRAASLELASATADGGALCGAVSGDDTRFNAALSRGELLSLSSCAARGALRRCRGVVPCAAIAVWGCAREVRAVGAGRCIVLAARIGRAVADRVGGALVAAMVANIVTVFAVSLSVTSCAVTRDWRCFSTSSSIRVAALLATRWLVRCALSPSWSASWLPLRDQAGRERGRLVANTAAEST